MLIKIKKNICFIDCSHNLKKLLIENLTMAHGIIFNLLNNSIESETLKNNEIKRLLFQNSLLHGPAGPSTRIRDVNVLFFLDFSFRYDSVHQKY